MLEARTVCAPKSTRKESHDAVRDSYRLNAISPFLLEQAKGLALSINIDLATAKKSRVSCSEFQNICSEHIAEETERSLDQDFTFDELVGLTALCLLYTSPSPRD